ncbi:Oidioi.mRNA.OKI2018_I69.XSR.g13722.t1.cds [Oikopleura dioica]|uniref:Oidioi.mRNA.OKI2018_I69.XSR.g13722.t1.cds n=1 Tax=Oikopleura dioica TaxID=34765 RepID=A0ABN7S7P7_OIKDI|nr:Oidioi.mRNA.OKI2018_I69.XSR.g13722.t1.cds [Oikopleura dioica]
MKLLKWVIFAACALASQKKECRSQAGGAGPEVKYVTSDGYPAKSKTVEECVWNLQVNYGQYIKIMPSTISVPCSGGGGVVFKELLKEGKKEREVSSKMYCGANAKIPSLVSTGVRLEIYFKAPPGSKLKIGYKMTESSGGTTVAQAGGARAVVGGSIKYNPHNKFTSRTSTSSNYAREVPLLGSKTPPKVESKGNPLVFLLAGVIVCGVVGSLMYKFMYAKEDDSPAPVMEKKAETKEVSNSALRTCSEETTDTNLSSN